ncbi:MAG: ester cyclase [Actinomycetota bacterium]|nr:ester cyclase [Actinomycetota bacterium]
MSNVDKHRDAHEAFNRRDWDGVIRDFAADAEYLDHPRGLTVKGAAQFVDYLRSGWVTAFSDAAVTDVRYTDAAERSIAQFAGTGTNDGALGPMPATGRSMNMPFCEIMTYGSDGRIVRGELYYDQVSMLVQLGHMPPPQG